MNIDKGEYLRETIRELWRQGEFYRVFLDSDQLEQHDLLWSENAAKVFVGLLARQRGKSTWALVEADTFARKNPGALIRYAAPSQKMVRTILAPIINQYLETCPDDLRPQFDSQQSMWAWPNGSQLHAFGVDSGHYEAGRGSKSDFIIADEAGFYPAADWDLIFGVLNPQLLTTNGMKLLISTPPTSLGHPFRAQYTAAAAIGRAIHRTAYGHPRLTAHQLERYFDGEASSRGQTTEEFKQSTHFRREYLAEFVTEESRAAIPAWSDEMARACVVEHQRPQYRDHYVSMDLGYVDGHGVLFAYWDFASSKLVIEDEIVLRHKDSDTLAKAIKAKEFELFGELKYDGTLLGATDWDSLPEYAANYIHSKAPKQPYLRVSDNDLLVLADISQRHGLTFMPTKKDDKANAVDDLNIAFRRGQIVISPRCKATQRQLFTTVWDKNRREWERSADGHGELIDAMVYLWRNVRKNKNPNPVLPKTEWEVWIEKQNKPLTNEWDKLRRTRR